ncbi:MAG: hypothetical protein WBB27_12245, partial [Maribacter sp.]
PYDMGSVCKHVAAIIFYLQEDTLSLDQDKKKKKITPKTKSPYKQITDILKSVSHQELKSFIEANSKNDKKFRDYFLSSFVHLIESQSKELYQRQINSILKTAAGRDGFIYWSEMKYVVKALAPFTDKAEEYFAEGNFENTIFISTALLEEITKAFQFGDDSNGDLGYFIEFSMQMLDQVTTCKLSENTRGELLEYCIDSFNEELFSGWDWHLGMLYIACELIENENEANTILECLDNVQSMYDKQQAQYLKLNLIKEFKGEAEAEKFMDQHISNPTIRRDQISKALQSKEYEKAIALSKNGIEFDKKEKPGLVSEWYDWLLKTAQAQNDTSGIIEYARYLLIDNFRAEQDYYQVLKSHVDEGKWHEFVNDIIKEITPKTRWKYTELIRTIYIKEAWWDRLFVLVKENSSLENIKNNEAYLDKDYTPELIALYTERITHYVKEHVGRSHYQTACRYLRRMKKLEANEQVNLLIQDFRKEYPQRRALIDELNKV